MRRITRYDLNWVQGFDALERRNRLAECHWVRTGISARGGTAGDGRVKGPASGGCSPGFL